MYVQSRRATKCMHLPSLLSLQSGFMRLQQHPESGTNQISVDVSEFPTACFYNVTTKTKPLIMSDYMQ